MLTQISPQFVTNPFQVVQGPSYFSDSAAELIGTVARDQEQEDAELVEAEAEEPGNSEETEVQNSEKKRKRGNETLKNGRRKIQNCSGTLERPMYQHQKLRSKSLNEKYAHLVGKNADC